MTILGISAFYHDAAAAIVENGQILAAAQEERFTRKKHDAGFPVHAIQYCLEFTGCSLDDLDAIVFYDKPLLKFERLLETYTTYAPKGLRSFIAAMPVWIREKLFLKKIIRDELNAIGKGSVKKVPLLFTEHHLSHAASAFFPSRFDRAAILTMDGVGEWATASIGVGEGNKITILKELHFPHSPGLLYSAFTYFLGFTVNSGEYKLMGLAPYGNPDSEQVKHFEQIIREKLVDIRDDGSLLLNQDYFRYATGLRMINDDKWKMLFGFRRRIPEGEIEQHHCNLALAIQRVTEDIVMKMAHTTKQLTGADYLCMAGGVALNSVANGKLDSSGLYSEIFVTPAAGDAGGALGAALAGHYIFYNAERIADRSKMDGLRGGFLGPEYTAGEILKFTRKCKAPYKQIENEEELCFQVAELISLGNIIGWHQGRMEFGPRALGARSILADARNPEMQHKLNLNIKYREGFRPFAPAVLMEDVGEYFDQHGSSPYMLLVKPVNVKHRKTLPAGYQDLSVREKLLIPRSDIPAVTHIDYSARIQTVDEETNPLFKKLLQAFKKITGCPMLINTSFNVRGEPIVNTPEEAYSCFMQTKMDYLIISNFIFNKKNQPAWELSKSMGKTLQVD